MKIFNRHIIIGGIFCFIYFLINVFQIFPIIFYSFFNFPLTHIIRAGFFDFINFFNGSSYYSYLILLASIVIIFFYGFIISYILDIKKLNTKIALVCGAIPFTILGIGSLTPLREILVYYAYPFFFLGIPLQIMTPESRIIFDISPNTTSDLILYPTIIFFTVGYFISSLVILIRKKNTKNNTI
jgi:hypothetical protein